MEKQSSPAGACVEFVYRVYEDGRRERLATILLPNKGGEMQPGPTRPTGELREFVVEAVREWRRVGIDPRAEMHRVHRQRR